MIPFFVLIVSYIYYDPFKVIKHYDNYHVICDMVPSVNRNYVSTMNYINKRSKYHYDSFIFGNSRSLYYRIEDWKKHIPSDSRCYHFSESGGSINGLYYKLRLIDSYGENIRNALFVVDHILLGNLEQHGALFVMPPALDKKNWFQFHKDHFSQWIKLKFLFAWCDYKITGKHKPYMDNYLSKGINYKYYDPISNEEPSGYQDSLIKCGIYYNNNRIKEFNNQQTPSIHSPVLADEEKRNSLLAMSAILSKHKTCFKIIISPLYDQVKLHPDDVKLLCEIFGENNVYDFSGVNDITADYHNYYEPSHYRPCIADSIMKIVYSSH